MELGGARQSCQASNRAVHEARIREFPVQMSKSYQIVALSGWCIGLWVTAALACGQSVETNHRIAQQIKFSKRV